jgi:F0F1-type ATP synthase assembly protein I
LLAKFFTSGYVPDRIMPPDDRNRSARGFGEGYSYVAVGFQLAVAMLVFGGLGWLVDGWLHTRPLFALVGFALATVGWFVSLYYRVQRDTDAAKREDAGRRGAGEERGGAGKGRA